MVRKVIERRGASTAGMLCSQPRRAASAIMYIERGAASSENRSHLLPAARRKRNLRGERPAGGSAVMQRRHFNQTVS